MSAEVFGYLKRHSGEMQPAEAEWLAIVDELYGTIKGLDRETIIWLAEDEELCGY